MLNKIVIVIAIILVIALGVFGYWYFTQDTAPQTTQEFVTNVRDFFPFGRNGSEGEGGGNGEETGTNAGTAPGEITENTPPPRLREIYKFPVAGAALFNEASSTVIRFLEKSTGNIFETKTDSMVVTRVSNTTVPKVAEALFVQKNSVFLRYLKDSGDLIETVYGTLSTTTSEAMLSELKSTYLTPNIREITLSSAKDKLFYLTETESGAQGFMANPDGTKSSVIFSSPLREWVVAWPKADTIALTSKASSEVPGFLYFLNPTTGRQKRVLGDMLGLTALTNPAATRVVYSQNNTAGTVFLSVFNVASSTATFTLSTPTLADKCVWGKTNVNVVYCAIPKNMPAAKYPDAWYQGLVSFNDNIWKIDTDTGTTELVVDAFALTGSDIDVTNLSLDTTDSFLLFTNKKNGSLWGYAFPL